MSKQAPLIVILGPTAVGKTSVSIALAKRFRGEIISADSRLLYRGMDIGTAKPTKEEQQRVPHHLIDVADPSETWSVAKFRTAALDVIRRIHLAKRIPFLVGGTGQYITAVLEGWNPPPRPKDGAIRQELHAFVEKNGAEALFERLRDLDPKSAERIGPTNVRRLIRALEIVRITGKPVGIGQENEPPPFRILRIGLNRPRTELHKRIELRIEKMFADGFQEEVQRLLAQGYGPELPAMSAIGYKQVAEALLEGGSIEDAKVEMRRLTKQFIRRQANWFKREDPKIKWFEMDAHVLVKVSSYIESFLAQ